MAESIGTLSANITAGTEGFSQALVRAEEMARSSGARIAAAMTSAGNAALAGATKSIKFIGTTIPQAIGGAYNATYGWLKGKYDQLGKAFANPIQGASDLLGYFGDQLNKIPLVGPLLAAPFHVMQGAIQFAMDTFFAGMDRIKNLGKSAASIGMRVEDFTILSQVLGDEETAKKALFKFQQHIADARGAAEGAKTAIDKIGLNGREFAKLAEKDMVAAFGQLQDRFKKVGDGALQARMAFEIFGKSGIAILPALVKGGEEIERVRNQFAQFGLMVDANAVASIKRFERAKKEWDNLKAGFNNQVTIALAPILAEIADRIGQVKVGWGNLADKIIDGLESAAMSVALFVDAWGSWDTTMAALGVTWDTLLAKILDGLALIADKMAILPTRDEWIKGTLENWGLGGMFAFGGLGILLPEKGAGEGLREVAEKKREQAWWDKLLLDMELEGRGATGARESIEKFFENVRRRKNGGGDNKQEQWLADMAALKERVDKIADALESVGVKFKNAVLEADAIGVMAPDLADQWRAKAFRDLMSAIDDPMAKKLQALEMGSREAAQVISDYADQGRESVQDKIKRLLELNNQQNEDQIRLGREVAAAVKGLNVAGIK